MKTKLKKLLPLVEELMEEHNKTAPVRPELYDLVAELKDILGQALRSPKQPLESTEE